MVDRRGRAARRDGTLVLITWWLVRLPDHRASRENSHPLVATALVAR